MSTRTTLFTLLAGALALTGGGAALAAEGPTTVTVTTVPTLTGGDRAPFDAPGVPSIRRGRAIPAGYALVGRRVVVERGAADAGAALLFRCPGTKTLRTFGVTGAAGFTSTADYVGRRQTRIVSFSSRSRSTGVVYAVCR